MRIMVEDDVYHRSKLLYVMGDSQLSVHWQISVTSLNERQT